MEKIQRPASIPLIAWIWIASGVFVIVTSVVGTGNLSDLKGLLPAAGAPGNTPPLIRTIEDLSAYFMWFTLIQVAMAVLAVVAGYCFLRLQAWARGALELLTWISLVTLVTAGVFLVPVWMAISRLLVPAGSGVDAHRIAMTGAVAMVIAVFVAAVPLAAMIRSLRSRAVKEAMRPRSVVRRT